MEASCTHGIATHRGLSLVYGCDREALGDLRFLELGLDDGARAFIDASFDAPHGGLALFARQLLGAFVSDYDANGMLGIYPMHLLSTEQWATLLSARGRLLDVGAGDGHVTAQLAPLFDEVDVTETSRPMARRLSARGYRVHTRDLSHSPLDSAFDVITLLNVIDRTARPLSMLRHARRMLAPDGALVVASPLPIRAHVHVGPDTVDPEEMIDAGGEWEHAARSLTRAIEALGYRAESISRVPYMSRGSQRRPVWLLDDAVLVLRGA